MIPKEIAAVAFDKQFFISLQLFQNRIYIFPKQKKMYSHEYQNNPIDSKTVQLLIQQQKSFPKSSIEPRIIQKKKKYLLTFFQY